jgi:DNA polymerase III epsilon subunit-like protein
MLSIDCEMTGLDPKRHAIISIGGINLDNPEQSFYGECRVFVGAEIDPEGLAVNGFTEAECLDDSKDSEKVMMHKLFDWMQEAQNYTLVGQNVTLDKEFLNEAFARSGIEFRFNHRVVDTHSVAYAQFLMQCRTIPSKIEKPKVSALNLDEILKYVGIPEEPRPHNALTGAKVSAEAFSRMVFKKKLLLDFDEFPLPEYLK